MSRRKFTPEEAKARRLQYDRDYAKAHSEGNKKAHRERRYGVGAHDHFVAQLEAQKESCAICGNDLELGRNTHLDHNHETGQWRGVLCVSCNARVGFLENKSWLKKATDYLRLWSVKCERTTES